MTDNTTHIMLSVSYHQISKVFCFDVLCLRIIDFDKRVMENTQTTISQKLALALALLDTAMNIDKFSYSLFRI